ncbi:LysR family transcriptional regulator [Microvirga sp. 17 mud 1-3]|uniref:LysR family transcriptional regulator n=1 Tax=Microvirga sp. 17 mud 1-3 TaxID=2082949 RepID=UPI000D6A9AAE|nr:LysR family transcriptional regulator [Microvirga sp. 17 mud 1-3]AWM87805.1 LysR family transcriptional regulator [Microvirga sp. 17 mud 1-3]
MNLKQLEVLKAIVATGSTVGASTILGISQSAISRHLTGLEAEIGFELFIRDKGRLIPRPEAKALVPEVEELTEVLARVRRKAADIKAGSSGDTLLRVAFPHSITTTLLPKVLSQYFELHPKAVVETLSGPYGAIEQMIQARSADLGFVRLPTEDQSFKVRPLLRGETTCVMAKGHPLASKEQVELKDLARNDLILLGRQRTARHELEYELRNARAPHHCRVEVHSVEAACACAAAGLGVAVVPALIASFFRSPEIVMRPFRPARISDYGIITLPSLPLSKRAEDFVALFAQEVISKATGTVSIDA